jgi:hypothetical protein
MLKSLGLLALLFPLTARTSIAQEVYCGDDFHGPRVIMMSSIVRDIDLLRTDDLLQLFLNAEAKKTIQRCKERGEISGVTRSAGLRSGIILDDLSLPSYAQQEVVQATFNGGPSWIFQKNLVPAILQQRASSKQMQGDFTAGAGITVWLSPADLKANPFPYQGKVVGVIDIFQQMIGSGEAVFGHDYDVVAMGIPNTLLTSPGTTAVLALKISGIRQLKIRGTDTAAAEGTYIDSHICETSKCTEFTGH